MENLSFEEFNGVIKASKDKIKILNVDSSNAGVRLHTENAVYTCVEADKGKVINDLLLSGLIQDIDHSRYGHWYRIYSTAERDALHQKEESFFDAVHNACTALFGHEHPFFADVNDIKRDVYPALYDKGFIPIVIWKKRQGSMLVQYNTTESREYTFRCPSFSSAFIHKMLLEFGYSLFECDTDASTYSGALWQVR